MLAPLNLQEVDDEYYSDGEHAPTDKSSGTGLYKRVLCISSILPDRRTSMKACENITEALKNQPEHAEEILK
jgi:hypothetical protein